MKTIRLSPLALLAGSAATVGLSLLSSMQGTDSAFIHGDVREFLSHVSMVDLPDGHGGFNRTLRITGINVQIVNGLGATNGRPTDPDSLDDALTRTNGVGNLIVGYNEMGNPLGDERTGSHNIVVGHGNSHSSFGGIVGPHDNMISGPFACVTGGHLNTASYRFSSVSGGWNNTASGAYSSISGGNNGVASGLAASVSGGNVNTASGYFSSASGGSENTASGPSASVSAGQSNTAYNGYSSVSGGRYNFANGSWSSVSGGWSRTASGGADWVAGTLFEDD